MNAIYKHMSDARVWFRKYVKFCFSTFIKINGVEK